MADDHGVMDVSECRDETPLAARRKVYWRTHKHPAIHKSSIEQKSLSRQDTSAEEEVMGSLPHGMRRRTHAGRRAQESSGRVGCSHFRHPNDPS